MKNSAIHSARGFTIIEVMIGMLIGLLGILVMLQAFETAEAQRRSTSSGNDAVSNGAAAFYALQRDFHQAGFGISETNLLGCSLQLQPGLNVPLSPLTVNPAAFAGIGDANTDTLLVMYGNPNGSPQGDGIATQTATNTYVVQTVTAFLAGDWVVAAPATRATPCNLLLDYVAAVGATNLTVNTGVTGMGNGSTLFNLGRRGDLSGGNRLTIRGYAIRGGALASCDFIDYSALAGGGNPTMVDCAVTTNWIEVTDGIVSLRAQYGRDTATATQVSNDPTQSYIVDTWDQTTPTTLCGWVRTPALRYVIVARASQPAGAGTTAAAPAWQGAATDALDLSALSNWQSYRYKPFESTALLRNVSWMGYRAGC